MNHPRILFLFYFILQQVVVILLSCSLGCCWSLSLLPKKNAIRRRRTVTFSSKPNKNNNNDPNRLLQLQALQSAFQQVVDSSEFLVKVNPLSCRVPLLGDDVLVEMAIQQQQHHDNHDSTATNVTLSVSGTSLSDDDFSWICVKFHEQRRVFLEEPALRLDISTALQPIVDWHFPPDTPGVKASTHATTTGRRLLETLFSDNNNNTTTLQSLKTNGYIILDNAPKTSQTQQDSLTKLTTLKMQESRQSDTIRTDRVQFLSQSELCVDCDMSQHYDCLMNLASFLNDHYYNCCNDDHDNNIIPAIPPATTIDNPLTNPERIQLAEYTYNGFYKTHRDNDYTNNKKRRINYRQFTAILYCNDDDWQEHHGGHLRLYYYDKSNASQQQSNEFIDILPKNGRLVLFDSFLRHAVRPNLHPTKPRRALTLWIKRPYIE